MSNHRNITEAKEVPTLLCDRTEASAPLGNYAMRTNILLAKMGSLTTKRPMVNLPDTSERLRSKCQVVTNLSSHRLDTYYIIFSNAPMSLLSCLSNVKALIVRSPGVFMKSTKSSTYPSLLHLT
jgi:hypothetical protein